jgi:hypothetical protein
VKCDFEIELRGQLVTVSCVAEAPDISVGIMGWGCSEAFLLAADDTPLDWELTPAELEACDARISQMAFDGYFEVGDEYG